MLSRNTLLFCALLAIPFTGSAADLAREYEQVKAIAARDPKVHAAYAAADRKLAERIVEIDPTLKGYVPGKTAPKSQAAQPAKPAQTAKPKAQVRSVRRDPNAFQRSHVVQKGETLGSIAAKYRVSTAELRKINDIRDEKKVPVGQVLALPNNAAKPQAAKKPAKTTRTTKTAKAEEKSWWDQVKGGF